MKFRLEFECEGRRLRNAFVQEVRSFCHQRRIGVGVGFLEGRIGYQIDIDLPEETGMDILKEHFNEECIFQIASTRREESTIAINYEFCP